MPIGGARRPFERWMPVAQLGVAVAVAALVLPTTLRPPPDQATASAEFSPDAPPDQKQPDSIFSSLSQAKSRGAGAAGGEGEVAAQRPVVLRPPKGECFGDPPQQIESVYSPPCQPGWQGNNGGATARGVSGDEIRIGFLMELTGTTSVDGPVPRTKAEAPPDESANLRTYRVLQAYFNKRYEFYGRQVRFYYVTNPSDQSGEAQKKARVTKAVDEFKIFAALQETNPDEIGELVRRGTVTYSLAQVPRAYYSYRRPYLWSFTPDATTLGDMGVEYYCKKLAGKPPEYADDPTFSYTQPRRVGIIAYDLPAYEDSVPRVRRLLKQQCNVDVVTDVRYTYEEERLADLSSAVTKLKAEGVTTIFYLGDLLAAIPFTSAADNNAYYPEWFLPGFGGVDTDPNLARAYNQNQWKNAFGFSVYEVPRPLQASECYRAYHSIEPDTDPNSGMCRYMWGHMVQLLGAIQETGPELTAQNFERGQFRIPRSEPHPTWRIAGGYGPDDYTYPDYAAEIWWDPTAPSGEDGRPGSYRYIDGGKRYALGQWPSGPSKVFKQGDSRAPD